MYIYIYIAGYQQESLSPSLSPSLALHPSLSPSLSLSPLSLSLSLSLLLLLSPPTLVSLGRCARAAQKSSRQCEGCNGSLRTLFHPRRDRGRWRVCLGLRSRRAARAQQQQIYIYIYIYLYTYIYIYIYIYIYRDLLPIAWNSGFPVAR